VIRRQWALDLAMVGILAVAVLVLFWQAALLQGVFFVQDMMVQNYPFRDYFSSALKAGSLPLWCAEINMGFPLFAEGQAGVLYPLNLLLARFLPTYAALNLNIVFHLWWAGVGTYLFLRAIGCGRAAALTSALTYACGGYLVIRAMSPNYIAAAAWLPFLFLCIEWALAHNRSVFLWLAGALLSLQFLAGHPQAAVYALIAAMLYGIYRGLLQGMGGRYWLLLLLGVPLIGAGIAAVQLLPTAELVQFSARSQGTGLKQFVNMSLPPERFITLLLPNFFGNSSTGSYWGREAGFFIQLCGYAGILPLLLSLVAVRERRDCFTSFFCVLAVVALILALGRYTAIFEWLYYIPGLKSFRIPTRFLLWFAFAIAVLSGLGLHQLLDGREQRSYKNWWYLCVLFALFAAAMVWQNRAILKAGDAALQGWGQIALHYREELYQELWRLGIMLLIGGFVLASRATGKTRLLLTVLVPLATYVDLYHFGHRFNATIDPAVLLERPATAAAIWADSERENGTSPRILSLVTERNAPYDWHSGWVHDQTSYLQYPATLRMYTGSLYGLTNVLPGWSPLHLKRQWEFTSGYPRFVGLAGVEYVVNYGALNWPGWQQISAGDLSVYKNSRALPQAYVVHDYQVIAKSSWRLHYLKSARFDPRHQVVLEEVPVRTSAAGDGRAHIARYGPEEVEIDWQGGGGILVLNDAYYPGWRVFVDGKEEHIMRANHVFRAVAVPAGANKVVFSYQPESFRWGMWVSGATFVLLVILVVMGFGQSLGSFRPLPTELGGVLAWSVQVFIMVVLYALVTRGEIWYQALARSRILAVLGMD